METEAKGRSANGSRAITKPLTGDLVAAGTSVALAIENDLASEILDTELQQSLPLPITSLHQSIETLNMRLDQFIQTRVIGALCRWVSVEPFSFQSLEGVLGRRWCGIGRQRVKTWRISLDSGSHFDEMPDTLRLDWSAQEWLVTGLVAGLHLRRDRF
jgi:hypothetical protein